jgi:hypothetical protein
VVKVRKEGGTIETVLTARLNRRGEMEIMEYNGCTITLHVCDRGRGWTWTYQVDSGPVMANAGLPHISEILARTDAISVATRDVDSAGLQRGRTPRSTSQASKTGTPIAQTSDHGTQAV